MRYFWLLASIAAVVAMMGCAGQTAVENASVTLVHEKLHQDQEFYRLEKIKDRVRVDVKEKTDDTVTLQKTGTVPPADFNQFLKKLESYEIWTLKNLAEKNTYMHEGVDYYTIKITKNKKQRYLWIEDPEKIEDIRYREIINIIADFALQYATTTVTF